MSRTIVQPNKLDLDSPGRRDYFVALEHDSIWGDYLIPLTVWVGKKAKEGKGLVATGANHGNEYEGPVAIKHLLREINIKDVAGRIILIPVLNPVAFRAASRESVGADGVNLNRAFVEGAGIHPAIRGITHRIVKFFREYIWPRVHVALDLHSGGQVASIVPCASFHPLDDPQHQAQTLETARWFGLPFMLNYWNSTPGLLPAEGENLGKIMVGCELGWGESVDIRGVRAARQAILAAAINQGQLRGKLKPIDDHAAGTQRLISAVKRECFVPAPFSGHYEPVAPLGSDVRAGQVVGFLHDFQRIDEAPWPVVCALDGVAFTHAWRSTVAQGQHIFIAGEVIGT